MLRVRQPPPSEFVVFGPRGNGRRSLLAWVQSEATEAFGLDVVRLTPADFDSEAEFADLVMASGEEVAHRDRSRRQPTIRRRAAAPRRVVDTDEAFSERASVKPWILLLDEAQTLDLRFGHGMLNDAQIVGREKPFLMVLAGTPNLRWHLGRMEAGFWSRGRQVPVTRLDDAAVAAAIRRPLAAADLTVSDEAVADLAAESRGYPYFVQLWGERLWMRLKATDSESVTRADVDACRAEVRHESEEWYRARCRELRRAGLLGPARTVADAFDGRSKMANFEVAGVIRRGLGREADHELVRATEEQFLDLGFIWRSGGIPDWEPGIPGLMDYLREVVPAP